MGKVFNKDQSKFFKTLESYDYELEEVTKKYDEKRGGVWHAYNPFTDMIIITVDANSICFMGFKLLNDKVKINESNRLELLNMINDLNLRSMLVNYSIVVDKPDKVDQLWFKCFYIGRYVKELFLEFIERWMFETDTALFDEEFTGLKKFMVIGQMLEGIEQRQK